MEIHDPNIRMLLPEPVDAADPLLDPHWVPRHVVVHQRPAELKIQAFGSRIWKPIATAESWNGGVATCNGFGFRFEHVGTARSLGGSWRTFAPGYTFEDRGYVVRQLRPAPSGQRTLSSDPIQAYAFDASSAA